ncbi:MAG: 5'/3'-nucleotidase SurE [Casimicrobiaceae bacterium]|nr:5'/3'-nucleotidase SurE [Casimicrobiaceae bacterium]MCX8098617.1 5'/3'-nucleotidase SurE [Casimicrobiaceae bacterium]MDW8312022.1 5'/3'-nucleotidase SurE [Burkholderiales bacterium]
MRILVSNDDGYAAPGLAALVDALSPLAELTVVAPSRDRSATSSSITVDRPLTIERAENGFYFIDGTPADCVHIALCGWLDFRPDLVVSGINHGSNLGDDTIYSGTVAAAIEGYLLGVPAMAFSLAGRPAQHYETAGRVARTLVERWQRFPHASPWLLNVNVPDVPLSQLRGIRTVRLGKRHQAEPVHRRVRPDGTTEYRIGAAGPAADAGPDTDFGAIAAGYASVTPLSVDLTRFDALPEVSRWLGAEAPTALIP